MEQKENQFDGQKFCCSICLELLRDPVTLPCGHNYCLICIRSFWADEGGVETHSCPQCRLTFTPRPVLVKNTMLAELVQELKKTGSSADQRSPEAADLACDVCTETKCKAVKSCLQCLVSFCEQHLEPHYKSPAFQNHKLVDPSARLRENVCSRHNEVMKIFCRTDQTCICYLCSMDEHKGHNTISAATEMAERQKELGASREAIQQRIQTREGDVKALQTEVEAINRHADGAVRDSEEIITQVKQQIRARQETEISRVKEFQQKLEQEIADLRRKDLELQRLSHTEDYVRFLHKYPPLSQLTGSTGSSGVSVQPQRCFEDVTADALSKARGELQDVLTKDWSKISLMETSLNGLSPQPEPETREEFLKYTHQITLDVNTANCGVYAGKRKAVTRSSNLNTKCHPDTFTSWPQVLCSETLTGRCYWEVEWQGDVFISVAYTNISRTGTESAFGSNDVSWALHCSKLRFNNYYEFRHNNIRTPISGPKAFKVGVYLDHSAGILSFYSIADAMTLLHRVQTTFTQPLCPGFAVYSHDLLITTTEDEYFYAPT